MPQFLLSNRFWTAFGAMLAALAVAAGAYGWHALEGDQAFRDIFMLAVQYHMWHALGLIAVGWRCAAGPGAAPPSAASVPPVRLARRGWDPGPRPPRRGLC